MYPPPRLEPTLLYQYSLKDTISTTNQKKVSSTADQPVTFLGDEHRALNTNKNLYPQTLGDPKNKAIIVWFLIVYFVQQITPVLVIGLLAIRQRHPVSRDLSPARN